MAERRMFAKSVIDSDVFLDMPATAQNLYFHLGMRTDDDGFVGNPNSIARSVGAANDDLKLLVIKRFIIPFENGVCVIRHWKVNNFIRQDRHRETIYSKEKQALTIDNAGIYQLCLSNDNQLPTQVSTDEDNISIDEDSYSYSYVESTGQNKSSTHIKQKQQKLPEIFKKPTIVEIENYCKERNNSINADKFFDYYEANGWMMGKNKMKDWRAAIRTWERSEKGSKEQSGNAVLKAIMEN